MSRKNQEHKFTSLPEKEATLAARSTNTVSKANGKRPQIVNSAISGKVLAPNIKSKKDSKKQDMKVNDTATPKPPVNEAKRQEVHTPLDLGQPENVAQAASKQAESVLEISEIEHTIVRVRKAISILFMLTDRPGNTCLANTSSFPPPDPKEPLPSPLAFEVEKQVIEDFTFLSSNTTDPLKVRALCLKRITKVGDEKFVLKVASNHGDLVHLKKGLEDIITHLKHSHSGDGPWNLTAPITGESTIADSKQDALLRSIVTLNFNRILCRLQSRHACWQGQFKKYKATKKPVPVQLFEDMTHTQAYRRINDSSGKFNSHLEDVKDLFSFLESTAFSDVGPDCPTAVSTLTNIIKKFYCLWRYPEFCAAVSSQQLLRQVAKIARYVTVAFSLSELGKGHPWLGQLKVETVKLDVVKLLPLTETSGSYQTSVSQLSIPPKVVQKLPKRLRYIDGYANKSQDETFVDIFNAKCAVHAEIQLLFHFELYDQESVPRIILSTKTPCFLCALFFRIHARCYVPESHGRLYEKWNFPDALKTLTGAKAKIMNHMLGRYLNSLSVQITHTLSGMGPGKLASTESFFRKSSIWARLSRAPSLVNLVESALKNKQPYIEELKTHYAALKHFRCSAAVLAMKHIEVLRLARGNTIAFHMDIPRADPIAIKTKHLRLLLSSDDEANNVTADNEPIPLVHGPTLVRIWHDNGSGIRKEEIQALSNHVVDVACLKPGEEITIGRELPAPASFVIAHKEDRLFVRMQKGCLSTVN